MPCARQYAALLLSTAFLSLAACVSAPPVPCTDCDGKCVDTQTDVAHCGGCGKACINGQQCVSGACRDTCPTGQQRCGGQCVDTSTDPRHCGACTAACAEGQACTSGVCTATCGAPLRACSGACVNVMNDRAHCGACGAACDAGVCVAGACRLTCSAPLVECPGALCVDVRSDLDHCGGCSAACAPQNVTAARCEAGACGYAACASGYVDCDRDPANGCESPTAACVELISVALGGGPANGPSYGAAVDHSGNRVVFISEATNLIANDTNTYADVFVRDVAAGTTVRLSVLPDGGELRADAGHPPVFANSFGAQVAISGDGRTIAVLTAAPLVPGDTNGGNDVVIFQPDGGRSFGMLSNGGAQPTGNLESCCVTLSDDGRYVTWATRANGSLVGPGTVEFNVIIHDRQARTTYLASPNGSNGYVTGGSVGFNAFTTWVSSNGRYVLYNSFGDNIVGPADGCSHSYLRDVPLAVNYRMSSNDSQAPLTCGFQAGAGGGASISANGLVAAMATNRMPPGRGEVFTRDMVNKRWTLVTTALDGGAANADSNGPTNLSDDGDVVVFGSAASNLTADDSNDAGVDCYAFVRSTGRRVRLNGPTLALNPDGGATPTGCSGFRVNSPGTHVVFDTLDSLRAGDGFGTRDVYLRRVR